MRPRVRIAILATVSIAAIVAVILHGPIPQPPGYHAFADQRALLGIPNFGNVMSNLAFLFVGWAGIRALVGQQPTGIIPSLRRAYLCLFAGIVLVGIGSGYYHLAPSDAALVWDRLPMTIAFMALFAIVIGEHIDPKIGLHVLAPLMVVGAGSVLYWHLSGDLRPYVVVQFLPLLLVPLILLLYPSRAVARGISLGTAGSVRRGETAGERRPSNLRVGTHRERTYAQTLERRAGHVSVGGCGQAQALGDGGFRSLKLLRRQARRPGAMHRDVLIATFAP